jgi:hypothetical protein
MIFFISFEKSFLKKLWTRENFSKKNKNFENFKKKLGELKNFEIFLNISGHDVT